MHIHRYIWIMYLCLQSDTPLGEWTVSIGVVYWTLSHTVLATRLKSRSHQASWRGSTSRPTTSRPWTTARSRHCRCWRSWWSGRTTSLSSPPCRSPWRSSTPATTRSAPEASTRRRSRYCRLSSAVRASLPWLVQGIHPSSQWQVRNTGAQHRCAIGGAIRKGVRGCCLGCSSLPSD